MHIIFRGPRPCTNLRKLHYLWTIHLFNQLLFRIFTQILLYLSWGLIDNAGDLNCANTNCTNIQLVVSAILTLKNHKCLLYYPLWLHRKALQILAFISSYEIPLPTCVKLTNSCVYLMIFYAKMCNLILSWDFLSVNDLFIHSFHTHT